MHHEDDRAFMRLALELAELAGREGEVPVGAVVVQDGVVIGRGANSPIKDCDPTAHAEIKALRDAAKQASNYRLPATTLYVTIEPCTMCLGALVHARIQRIVYGATEPKAGMLESNACLLDGEHFNHQLEWQGGVLAEECSALISSFFAKRRERKAAIKARAVTHASEGK